MLKAAYALAEAHVDQNVHSNPYLPVAVTSWVAQLHGTQRLQQLPFQSTMYTNSDALLVKT